MGFSFKECGEFLSGMLSPSIFDIMYTQLEGQLKFVEKHDLVVLNSLLGVQSSG